LPQGLVLRRLLFCTGREDSVDGERWRMHWRARQAM
jgi:hypothetical protein